MGGLDQDVDAVGADRADEEGGEEAEGETSVAEGHRHREYARAQAPLEQMYERVEVRGGMGELAVLERIVKGGLLVGRSLHERQGRAVRDRNGHVIFLTLVSAKPVALAYRGVIAGENDFREWDVNYVYTGCSRKDVAASFIYEPFDQFSQKLERDI